MQTPPNDRRTILAFQDLIETWQQVSARSVIAMIQWPVFVAYLMRTRQ